MPSMIDSWDFYYHEMLTEVAFEFLVIISFQTELEFMIDQETCVIDNF